jgi:hypothetical protein
MIYGRVANIPQSKHHSGASYAPSLHGTQNATAMHEPSCPSPLGDSKERRAFPRFLASFPFPGTFVKQGP